MFFHRYKSYFVKPSNPDQVVTLYHLAEELGLDFLSYPVPDREVAVLVRPEAHGGFLRATSKYNITQRLHANNVKEYVFINISSLI